MSRLRGYAATLCVLAALALVRCSLHGTIIDHSRYEVNVKRLRLARGDAVHIVHGDIEAAVPLGDIERIEIDPAFSRTFNRRLYYKAEISLKEGRTLRGPGGRQKGPAGTYVSVQHVLTGQAQDGEFSISLDKVSRLTVD